MTMLALAVVVSVLLAPYLRTWLGQEAEIAQVQAAVAGHKERVAELTQEQARWQDPAYVSAQARERLHYVFPGETGFVVPESEQAQVAAEQAALQPPSDPAEAVAETLPAGDRPWFGDVWESVRVADAR